MNNLQYLSINMQQQLQLKPLSQEQWYQEAVAQAPSAQGICLCKIDKCSSHLMVLRPGCVQVSLYVFLTCA